MLEHLWRHDGWGIGIVRASLPALLASTRPPAVEWLPLSAPHRFFADPFAIVHAGRTYCFFESLHYDDNRGEIAFVRLDQPVLRVEPAFRSPHHLSYPYLLAHEGEVLCIPECFESGRVAVWAARDFPYGWRERATLLEGFPGVDPTPVQHDGRWWLFATDGHGAANTDLYAWYADDLLGRWRPHAANPIKRDLGSARPAGTPFVHDGRLYRPAQDCRRRYGARLVINEVLELSPTRFAERVVGQLEPDPLGAFPDGLHTASGCGAFTVVDGNRLRFEPRAAARSLGAYAQRARSALRGAR